MFLQLFLLVTHPIQKNLFSSRENILFKYWTSSYCKSRLPDQINTWVGLEWTSSTGM